MVVVTSYCGDVFGVREADYSWWKNGWTQRYETC